MRKIHIKLGDSGSVLILTLIFSVILTIGVGGYLTFVNGQARIVKHYANYGSAFYLAEAGIDKAIIELENYSSPPSVFPGIEETGLGDGTYQVLSASATYLGDNIKYELHSIGTVNGVDREVVAEVQTESFAKYIYFTHTENHLIHWWWWWFEVPVWFTTGSYLEGCVHTNGQYNVSGYPVFNGPISSVANTINYMHGPDHDGIKFYDETCDSYDAARDAKFEPDELSLGVKEINTSFLSADRLKAGAAEAGGMSLTGDTTIILLEDGTMNVTNEELENSEELGPNTQNINLPANGALFVNGGDLRISGTLNGVITVGASGDVIIIDDLIYNSDPRQNPASEDKLGIIAEKNVIIDEDAPQDADPPDPGGVSVHASIIALDKSFTVEHWWSGAKEVLTILGGIIQKRRGPVGTFNPANNQKVSGYDKNYQYDLRMRTSPPPFFPKTGKYEMIYWREV